jgi:hypothetical protein
MSDGGRLQKPGTPTGTLEKASEDSIHPGSSVQADRQWAQNRIANFRRGQQVMRKPAESEPKQAEHAGKEADGAKVSQPGDPAEKEADAVADHVADQIHGDGKNAKTGEHGAAGKEQAPAIGAKLEPSAIFRMPKWPGGDEDADNGRGEKGKSFRGGKKKDRDNWYGFDDPDFQNWWHRVGKQEFGHGKDLDNRQQAQAAFNYWVQQGKPKGGK